MNRKTILWIYNHPLKPEAGGTERITSLVMRGLSANGHKCLGIMVIDSVKGIVNYDNIEVHDIYSFLKQKHVDTVINQCGHGKEMLEFFLEEGGMKWHDEGGRIITCLHYDPKPYSIHYQFRTKPNKSIRDYFVIIKTWLLEKWYARQDQKRIGVIYKYNYINSDFYVLLSETFILYVKVSLGMNELPKLVAINNPLTFDCIATESVIDTKKNVILVVSRMYEYQKRISLVLKVWEKLSVKSIFKDWTLKIVGDGDDLNEYKEYALLHNLKRISFEGQQSPEQYYRDAKIFLMTSQMEGWGLTLTESLQYGVVPVAFDKCSAFHDIIEDGVNGFLVREGKMSCFINKIENLAKNQRLWKQMSKNALNSAEKFRIDVIIKKWEKII